MYNSYILSDECTNKPTNNLDTFLFRLWGYVKGNEITDILCRLGQGFLLGLALGMGLGLEKDWC